MSQMGSLIRRSRASVSSAGQSMTAGLYGSKVLSNGLQNRPLCASLPMRKGDGSNELTSEDSGIEEEFMNVPPASSRVLPRAQEMEEFDALAQAALHHFRTHDHLSHDGRDFGRAEIEFLIEILHRFEYFGMTQVRIAQRRDLRALLRQKVDLLIVEPAVFLRLPVEKGAWIGSRE